MEIVNGTTVKRNDSPVKGMHGVCVSDPYPATNGTAIQVSWENGTTYPVYLTSLEIRYI